MNRVAAWILTLLMVFAPHIARAESLAYAELQILDKVTTQKQNIQLVVGRASVYGNLRLLPRRCDAYDVESKSEAAAFLEIYDTKRGDGKKPIFSGWMFKSSPSLSSLEHAIYDVVLLGCSNNPSQAKSASPQ